VEYVRYEILRAAKMPMLKRPEDEDISETLVSTCDSTTQNNIDIPWKKLNNKWSAEVL
jgi:hypothetical protein